jgi:hypothetical protein
MTTTTTTPADDWVVKRGQRMIPDEATGELVPYTRVSTYAKALDTMGVLGSWLAWQALKGAEVNPAAKQRALHAERTPVKTIDELVEAGGGRAAANKGSDRHQLVAMALKGQPLPDMPAQARHELDAVVSTILLLGSPVAVETATVCDVYRTAGTVDFVLKTPAGMPIVGELKTGNSWGAAQQLSAGIQLAVHGRSRYWDQQTQTRGDWVALNRPRLVVIHAPQSGGKPRILDVDPQAATRWADLARQVIDARKEAKP